MTPTPPSNSTLQSRFRFHRHRNAVPFDGIHTTASSVSATPVSPLIDAGRDDWALENNEVEEETEEADAEGEPSEEGEDGDGEDDESEEDEDEEEEGGIEEGLYDPISTSSCQLNSAPRHRPADILHSCRW